MMINPAQAAKIAEKLSDDQLAALASGQTPTPQFPLYVAMSEMQRRAELRKSMQGMNAMAANAQDRTVLEELLDGKPIQPDGIGSLPAMMQPQQPQAQQQPALAQGQPQGQAQQPQSAPPRGYARGGLVALDKGGYINPNTNPSSLHPERSLGVDWDFVPKTWHWMQENFDKMERPWRYREPITQRDIDYEGFDFADPPINVPAPVEDASRVAGQPAGPSTSTTRSVRAGVPVFQPQPVEVNIPEFLTRELRDSPTMADLMREREALMPTGQAHSALEEESARMAEEIAQRKRMSTGEALLQAGATMAASRSPYFLSAAGEGALSGLQSLRASRGETDKLQALKTQYASTVDAARRAEAIGNVDAAMNLKAKAEELRQKIVNSMGIFASYDITSQRGLQGDFARAQATMAQSETTRELAHLDRERATEARIMSDAYDAALKALKDDINAINLTESQKEEIAKRWANNARANWRRGVAEPTAQRQGTLRGTLDASGNLHQ